MLHTTEVRKKHLRKEIKEIKLEAMSGSIKNYNSHVNAYLINDELVSFESMSMWIKKEQEIFEQTLKEVGSKSKRTCYY